jgi:uncharacterized protein YcnI
MRGNRIGKLVLAAGTAIGMVALGAGVAAAHVTVDAPGATQGGSDQMINVRVPTESDTATTVGLKLQLPVATPIASVLVQPTFGWTFTTKTITLSTPIKTDDGDITSAVSEIDWTAASGQGIPVGGFQDFVLIAGQLPDTATLTFKAIQSYSDGSTVNWIETAAPGSTADLAHPAPTLSLAPAPSGPAPAGSDAPAAVAVTKSSSNTGPVVLSIVALVVAAGALGVAVVGRARQRAAA